MDAFRMQYVTICNTGGIREGGEYCRTKRILYEFKSIVNEIWNTLSMPCKFTSYLGYSTLIYSILTIQLRKNIQNRCSRRHLENANLPKCIKSSLQKDYSTIRLTREINEKRLGNAPNYCSCNLH